MSASPLLRLVLLVALFTVAPAALAQAPLPFALESAVGDTLVQVDPDGHLVARVGLRFADGTVQTTAATAGAAAWLLGGNAGTTPGTDFLGTTDVTAFEVHVGGLRVMRYEPGTATQGPNVIGGWSGNTVSGGVRGATIAGGGDPADLGAAPNRVEANYSTIGGGVGNTASGTNATVSGGRRNIASGFQATVGGGLSNTASGANTTIGGGSDHTASGSNATIAGGDANTASGGNTTVAGGILNKALNSFSTVGGGSQNTANGDQATVGGGQSNRATGVAATVGGGNGNTASGDFAAVPGGNASAANAAYSFAAGRRARANHDGAFVWADDENANFASDTTNSFNIRARGGFRLVGAAGDLLTVGSGGALRLASASGDLFTVGTDGAFRLVGTAGDLLAVEPDGTVVPGLGLRFPDGTVQTTAPVSAAPAWLLGGNTGTSPGTDFLGTTDATAFELHAGGARALRVEPETATEGPNVLGGWSGNALAPGVVGATIAGGGDPDAVGSPRPNTAEADYSTVSGGQGNTASGGEATVGGGQGNTASALYATVGGGVNNTASGVRATIGGGDGNTAGGLNAAVPGGRSNAASGDYSLAAGRRAQATHTGAFVWADSDDADFASNGDNTFNVRAHGGLYYEHGAAGPTSAVWPVRVLNATQTGVFQGGLRLTDDGFFDVTNRAGDPAANFARLVSSGAWTQVSDARLKTGVRDAEGLLGRALALRPVRYRMTADGSGTEHVGLIAQEVRAVLPEFVAGDEAVGYLTVDYAGLSVVALGALQAQQQLIERQQSEIDALQREVDTLRAERDQAASLEARLARLEARLDAAAGPAPSISTAVQR